MSDFVNRLVYGTASRKPAPRAKKTSVAGAARQAGQAKKAKRVFGAARDRATAYAKGVLAGDIIAGPHVRDACARHLRDLDEGPARGLIWNVAEAEESIAFFEEVLCLNGGEFEGKPFILDQWQCFIVGSIYGWQTEHETKGLIRRFNMVYVETAKGSGKSPLAAGVGMKGLVADGEPRAEIYAAATKKDQAMILFRDAVAMRDQSPELERRVTKSGVGERTWNMAYPANASFFRPIAAEDGNSGPRPHVGLVDEYHEHKTNAVLGMLQAGWKSRRQPFTFVITNSGAGKQTPCGIEHDYAVEVAAGRAVNDAYFAFVCGLDEGEDPFESEACWPKVNPSLQFHGLPGVDYLRKQVTNARGIPSKESLVRRLNFCQWTAAINPWLSAAVWDPCRLDFDALDLRGRRAFGGLDLSSTTDLCAFTLLVEPADPIVTVRWEAWAVAKALHDQDPLSAAHPGDEPPRGEPYKLLNWCWLPEGGPDNSLEKRSQKDRVDYVAWAKQGFLEVTPGAAVSKHFVLQRVAQICAQFDVPHIAADRWRLADFKQQAADAGITLPELLPFGQGFQDMSPAIDAFETAVLNRTVAHNGHPVHTWCASNAVTVSDAAGNRKLDKSKATGRIDLMVSDVMAHASKVKPDMRQDLDAFLNNLIVG
ncbi:terminase TerL endonuclease subunit [Roseateles asaccharophilus]|uniref:Phage terminase large subunit-like protein n=1 Tax=Roseateles asaccharophilus TaxID=582607 RepID=A0ABU2A549_9BURK|nr:terminase TerL endonuclease subunit [Roseateles asaccharophilus]MDR7331753.1 phage terminase large subunit-like protein [Roseateles asaccharophilus]